MSPPPCRQIKKQVRLHPAQLEFRRSTALYRGFVGGRGAGKTWVGAFDMLCRAKKGRTYSVVSPTSIISGDTTFPTTKQLANDLDILADLKLSPYPSITTTTGATIRFRTADDPEKLRGPNLSGVWLDEASLMSLEAYNISIASLREGGEQGWLSATFTPKGIYHWTFDVFAKARVDTQIFRAATAENPFNPPGFSETLAGQYSPTFARQELGGEFLEIDGAEWPSAWFGESIWFDRWPHDLSILVIALDPSTGKDAHHGDYSALVALGRSGDGKLWCEADLSRRPMNQIVSDGINFARRIESEARGHLAAFGVESNAFQQLLAAEFKTRTATAGIMLPIVEVQNNVNKLVRIRRLTPHLSQGNIMFSRTQGTELLVRQLREFPIGEHDDGPDALEMARRIAIENWNRSQQSRPAERLRVR